MRLASSPQQNSPPQTLDFQLFASHAKQRHGRLNSSRKSCNYSNQSNGVSSSRTESIPFYQSHRGQVVVQRMKSNSPYANETMTALMHVGSEQEVIDADLLLPVVLPFKRVQMSEKYPKGHARGRHWKHLKQILKAENYHLSPADEPTYVNTESAPSVYPAKKYCDITGFEAPYTDPRTKLRFASVDVFKRIRSLSDEHIQGYLALRNAAVVLK